MGVGCCESSWRNEVLIPDHMYQILPQKSREQPPSPSGPVRQDKTSYAPSTAQHMYVI